MIQCDFCLNEAKYATAQQISMYCDDLQCYEKALNLEKQTLDRLDKELETEREEDEHRT